MKRYGKVSNLGDSPHKSSLMLLNCIFIPRPWIEVGRDEDAFWYPVDESSLHWHLHRIAVKKFEQVGELEL